MATPKQGPTTQTWTITIDAHYQASPPNLSVSDGDTIEFHNTTDEDCSIYFNPEGVLTQNEYTPVPARGTTSLTVPNNLSETDDYVVVEPDQSTQGPYSITVDNGPLPVTVDSEGNCQPTEAAIPTNGSLYFGYDQTDPNVPSLVVDFTYEDPNAPAFHDENGEPVSSQTLNPGDNGTLKARGSAQNVSYTISPRSREDGGGTVKIGSGGTTGEPGQGQ